MGESKEPKIEKEPVSSDEEVTDIPEPAKKSKDSKDKESKKDKKEKKKEKKDKKRKNDDIEEISIDLNLAVPLSKKQKRLVKKGKVTLEQLDSKNPKPRPENAEETEEEKKSKKSAFGVWIGNLSFDTSREDLIRFLVAKTSTYEEFTSELNKESPKELVKILEKDITRVNLPRNEKQIKGFAYVDFQYSNYVATAVSLSEQVLNGRKLLIKDATSFEGRPVKDPSLALSKNPPSRILFVGNLSFDTTKELLEEHFRHCGEIIKIRMATFEDTGKCKGFAFIDFKNEECATNALKDKSCKKLINRPLRMEFGEDRSKRVPNQRKQDEINAARELNGGSIARERFGEDKPRFERTERTEKSEKPFERKERPERVAPKKVFNENSSNNRLKSSIALASAQRASAAIVPSAGKKITFG